MLHNLSWFCRLPCVSTCHIHLVQAAASHVTSYLDSLPTGMFSKCHIDKLILQMPFSFCFFYFFAVSFGAAFDANRNRHVDWVKNTCWKRHRNAESNFRKNIHFWVLFFFFFFSLSHMCFWVVASCFNYGGMFNISNSLRGWSGVLVRST